MAESAPPPVPGGQSGNQGQGGQQPQPQAQQHTPPQGGGQQGGMDWQGQMNMEMMKKQLMGEGGIVSLAGKGLFVIGLALFAICQFMNGWTENAADRARAEARAAKANYWELPPEPAPPRYPPNPQSKSYKYAFLKKKGEDETEVDVPASAIKEYEDAKDEHKKALTEWSLTDKKEWFETRYNWKKNNWRTLGEDRYNASYYDQEADRLRYKSTISFMGYFLRWGGIALMFLGLATLMLKGTKEEQLVSLLVMGIGLARFVM